MLDLIERILGHWMTSMACLSFLLASCGASIAQYLAVAVIFVYFDQRITEIAAALKARSQSNG